MKKSNKAYAFIVLSFVLVASVTLYFARDFWLYNSHFLEVYFLDVGQGDCEYIKTPNGKSVLIDGGGRVNSEFEVGKNIVKPFLNKHGVFALNVATISHFHQDHAKGISELFDEMSIENLIIPSVESNASKSSLYFEINNKAKQQHTSIVPMKWHQSFVMDEDVNFLSLFPSKELYKNESCNINNESLVLKMKYKKTSFLFTGDIERDAEEVIRNDPELKSDVLKVAHHGSKTSTSEEILRAISPKYAVIEVGERNLYHHPHKEVTKRLADFVPQIYRTDMHGTIKFIVDQNGIVKIEKSKDK